MALQKRLERQRRLARPEERLQCAEENLANVLSHQTTRPQNKSVHWSKTVSVFDVSDESDSD